MKGARVMGGAMGRMNRAGWLLPVCVLLALGCGGDVTQILVEVYAADDIAVDVTGVRIRVEGRGRDDVFADAPPVYLTETAVPASGGDFPLVHVIAPLNDDATRLYRVTAEALVSDASGTRTISEARAISGFVDGETRVLRLYLPGGACRDRTCIVSQTCVQGTCEDLNPIPPELLPLPGSEFDAGVVVDAGPDAPSCAGEGDECSDGLALCEVGHIRCDAESGEPVCVGDGVRSEGTVCRADDGVCDVEEVCDGVGLECPVDEPEMDGSVCGEGQICLAGDCITCDPGVMCDTGNKCELGFLECTESGGECVAADPRTAGEVCRPALGVCDAPEVCDGVARTCPADAPVASGTMCRGVMGACDVADLCDGVRFDCPNAVAVGGSTCRESAGLCDLPEACDGVSPTCPMDRKQDAGQMCRPQTDPVCDLNETCDGTSPECPTDQFAMAGVTCAEGGLCNGSGECTSAGCGEACSLRPCAPNGTFDCSSGAPVCVAPNLSAGTVCRPAADGGCDVAETCTGSSPTCPADVKRPSSFECRPPVGNCDLPEMCSGTSNTCPMDNVRSSGFVCRNAGTGL